MGWSFHVLFEGILLPKGRRVGFDQAGDLCEVRLLRGFHLGRVIEVEVGRKSI